MLVRKIGTETRWDRWTHEHEFARRENNLLAGGVHELHWLESNVVAVAILVL